MSLEVETRLVVVTLAAYAAASLVVSLLVAASWRRLVRAPPRVGPRGLARRLLALRALPCALGVGAAALFGDAFARCEPALRREEVGPFALGLAVIGALSFGAAATRALLSARATGELVRRWSAASTARMEGLAVEALKVGTPFPVVALTGCLYPRLWVASCVVEECSPEELTAIVDHELAHLRARDNLRRVLFTACPDPLAWLPASRAMECAWQEAAEQAADEAAAGEDPRRRRTLASALIRVARLAVTGAILPRQASALFRGEPVADRVRRLLSPAGAAGEREFEPRPLSLLLAVGALALVAALASVALSRPDLHAVAEAVVRVGR